MNEKRTIAYIGLGSNIGDRLAHCREALRRITSRPENARYRLSSLYESEAHVLNLQNKDSPPYVNAVLELETPLSPEELFQRLLGVEHGLGREFNEKGKWLPRSIDLDLLAYGDRVIQTPKLCIPHPRLHERRFVLVPWAELAPDWMHPVLGRSIRDLLTILKDAKTVTKICSF